MASRRPPEKSQKTTKPEPTRDTTRASRTPLEHALDRLLVAYARHMLAFERPLPTFSARLDGAHVVAEIDAPDGVQTIRRRPSAYIGLCADVWGRAQAPDDRARCPSLVAAFSTHPDGRANEWGKMYDLEVDLDRIEGLEAIAQALLDAGDAAARDEAILLLRRLYAVDESAWKDGLYVRVSPRRAPPAIARAVRAPSGVPERPETKTTTPHAMVKHAVPYLHPGNPIDLLAFGMRVDDALPHLSLSNHLTFVALLEEALPAMLAEKDGAVHEVALGIAQNLGMKLFNKGAYAEAKPLLDIVIAHHGTLPESLRARWECRLYLDACAGAADLDAAEEDWARAAELDAPTDRSSVGACMFWAGDVRDRRRVALARVAKALMARANGGDPYAHRKVTKRNAPTPEEQRRLIARAAALSEVAIESGASRAAADLERARSGESITPRGFQADELAARAKVREGSGDLAGALSDYEAARGMRIAAGLAWQIDHFGPDVRRLRRRLHGGGATTPESFDPDWLVDPARTSAERESAVAAWHAQPWRVFPKTPGAARDGVLPYVILRDVLAHSAELWRIAEKDGKPLGDRVAFGERALAYLDGFFDRRDASRLESVLDDAHEVAFFREGTNVEAKPKKERAALVAYVAGLAAAERIDADAIVRGLEGAPWANLRARFDAEAYTYDPLRDVLDAARGAGLSGDDVAVVVRAYALLLTNDWSSLGAPRGAAAKWAKEGDALAKLDAERLAPALIAWTRAYASGWGVAVSAKWLWPLRYVWSDAVCPAFVEDVKKGRVDAKKTLSKSAKAARAECLAWIAAR